MKALFDRVFELKYEDLGWPFDGGPRFSVGQYSTVTVDPFPCYAHDVNLVREMAEFVEQRFPIGFPPKWYVLHFEDVARTNGHSSRDWSYDSKPRIWEPRIVLSGKRIPIHPAMTRYLVAHEYGHVVHYWISHRRGDENEEALKHEYLKIRVGTAMRYGGGRWHSNVGELIANDFRICVTGLEPEFWPHPGFEHPLKLDVIRGFWARMVEEYSFRPQPVDMCNEAAMTVRTKEDKAA